jgi:hypothetical protein
MDSEDFIGRVRALHARGCNPRQIARTLGVPRTKVAPVVQTITAEEPADAPQRPIVGCWVSPGWSAGLSVHGHPDWPGLGAPESGASGLVSVLVGREQGPSRVRVYGYLVDVYCLGLKDFLGPRAMDRHDLAELTRSHFAAYHAPPLAAPIELARHIVFGAIEYARNLGFAPPPGFFPAAAAHLGPWAGPGAIEFGNQGKPYFIQGPRDDPDSVMETLERSVGRDNFHYLVLA